MRYQLGVSSKWGLQQSKMCWSLSRNLWHKCKMSSQKPQSNL
jgi:hypothetical protein